MVAAHTSYLAKMFEGIARELPPEVARAILNAKLDDVTRQRIEYLREQANEGRLSDAERAEYADYVEAVDIVSILHAKARVAAAQSSK